MPGPGDLVINTGPVLALAAAGHLQILREFFAKVTVPYEVVQEIEAGGRTQFAREEFARLPGSTSAPRLFLYRTCCSPHWTPEKRLSSRSQRLNKFRPWRSTKPSGVVLRDCTV